MSIEKIGKGFEGNKDLINDDIMKILRIFILMIVNYFEGNVLGMWIN